MSSKNISFMLVLLLLILGAATPGVAAEPDQDASERAAEYFEAGAELFFEGRYGRALIEFRRAHRLTPHPMILYNISLAHFRLGQISDALKAAQQASTMEGFPPNEWVRNQARIEGFEAILVAQSLSDGISKHLAREDEPVRDQKPDEVQQQKEAQAARSPKQTLKTETAPTVKGDHRYPDPPPAQNKLGALGWTGVTITTTGAGVLGYSLLLNHWLGDKIKAYQESALTNDRASYDDLRLEITEMSKRGQLALYAGGGAAALGLTLLIIDLTTGAHRSSPSALSLTTSTTDAGSFIFLNGQF